MATNLHAIQKEDEEANVTLSYSTYTEPEVSADEWDAMYRARMPANERVAREEVAGWLWGNHGAIRRFREGEINGTTFANQFSEELREKLASLDLMNVPEHPPMPKKRFRFIELDKPFGPPAGFIEPDEPFGPPAELIAQVEAMDLKPAPPRTCLYPNRLPSIPYSAEDQAFADACAAKGEAEGSAFVAACSWGIKYPFGAPNAPEAPWNKDPAWPQSQWKSKPARA